MVKRRKRRRMKNFQQLYNLVMKHLTEGQKQVLLGELLLKIIPPKFPEDGIGIRIRRNDNVAKGTAEHKDKIVRRHLFEPDEIVMYARTKRSDTRNLPNRFLVYVFNEEDSKLYRCEFRMYEPLENLKETFPNAYIRHIVDGLLSYDGE